MGAQSSNFSRKALASRLLLFLGAQASSPLFLSLCLTLLTIAPAPGLDRANDAANKPSPLGAKVYDEAETIFEKASDIHYQHTKESAPEQVTFSADGRACTSYNDCSGFVSYLLDRIVPSQYAQIHELQKSHSYPQAMTFARFFSSLQSGKPDHGWLKIDTPDQLRRGDMIAWEKPLAPGQKRGNSGHVMIVAEPATKIETSTIENATIKYAEIPVIDSSSVDHFEPAQLPPHALQKHRDGVGKGCVRLILDQSNHPIGYWEGSYWNEGGKEIRHPTMTDHIGCARLMAEQN